MKKDQIKLFARALQAAGQGKKKSEIDALVQSFVLQWGTRGKVKFLSAVLKALEQSVEQEKGTLRVLCRVASGAEKGAKSLTTLLAKQLKKDVEITVVEDPSLIAGAVVTYGDTRIDGSVKARLNQLEKFLH